MRAGKKCKLLPAFVVKQDVNTTLLFFSEQNSEGRLTGVQKERGKKKALEDSHPPYNIPGYEGVSFLSPVFLICIFTIYPKKCLKNLNSKILRHKA